MFQISLAAARVNANMTQEDVAEKMNVSKASIINWEKGRTIPNVPELNMMCQLYGVPVDYIFLPESSTQSRASRGSGVKT